jgi:hypothetical protein
MDAGGSGSAARPAYLPVLAGFEITPAAAFDNPEQRAADGGLLLGQHPLERGAVERRLRPNPTGALA